MLLGISSIDNESKDNHKNDVNTKLRKQFSRAVKVFKFLENLSLILHDCITFVAMYDVM